MHTVRHVSNVCCIYDEYLTRYVLWRFKYIKFGDMSPMYRKYNVSTYNIFVNEKDYNGCGGNVVYFSFVYEYMFSYIHMCKGRH